MLGVIHLKDVVKQGMRERFDEMRRMGIRTVMITGDNPLTAKAIADEAGVDDFLAEATPEDKMALIKREQEGGKLVAMTGDGTNDAPALAQADVGVAMNTGTSAAKEAGNMVDLDSDPTKLIEIVEIGKQLLITRGALTTFSIANDVAKYFAIIPAMFAAVYPGLDTLNVMRLHSPQSAILSAVIFNALVIVALIPLALRGVRYTPVQRHRRCCAATSASTASAASSRRSSASSSSTSSSSSSPGSVIDHASASLASPAPRRAARAARASPSCSASAYPLRGHRGRPAARAAARRPTARWSRADGTVVGSALIGQTFTDAKGNPLPQYFQSAAVGRRRRLRPDRHRRQQPRPGVGRGHRRRPSRSLLTQVCTRSLAIGKLDGVDGARPVLHRRRRRRGAGASSTRGRAIAARSPGWSASTRPARPRRSSRRTRASRWSAPRAGEDYAAGQLVPIRGDAPAHPAVPADAVTASGSGLDPDISPAYAAQQAAGGPRRATSRWRRSPPSCTATPPGGPWASSANPPSTCSG